MGIVGMSIDVSKAPGIEGYIERVPPEVLYCIQKYMPKGNENGLIAKCAYAFAESLLETKIESEKEDIDPRVIAGVSIFWVFKLLNFGLCDEVGVDVAQRMTVRYIAERMLGKEGAYYSLKSRILRRPDPEVIELEERILNY